jgi:fatty-acyl-CoA synthase
VDAVTYSALVPGADGRAGMAAIVIDDCFEFDAFAAHLAGRLPAYAHPLFLRIRPTLDTTETFKLKKQQLTREGFDLNVVDEPLYFRDPERGGYRLLDPASFSKIATGAVRF